MPRILENTLARSAEVVRRLASEAEDVIDEVAIAAFFEESNRRYLDAGRWQGITGYRGVIEMIARREPGGPKHQPGKAAIPATMVACIENRNNQYAAEPGLFEWTFEYAIAVKFSDYFRRHFGAHVVSLAQARLDAWRVS